MDTDSDDQQLGHILSRREVFALLGIAGVSLLAACAPGQAASTPVPTSTPVQPTTVARNAGATPLTPHQGSPAAAASAQVQGGTATAIPACIVRPEGTEGPYYVTEVLNRADVRADPRTGAVKDGALLTLTFNVSQIASAGCTPLPGAKVDIWHCDATGAYSDVADPGFSTKGQQFLRGYQVTDTRGKATFTTIYPGWYRGRAIHIHFKISPESSKIFTSQLFFDDALSDQVFAQAPYAGRGTRDRRNKQDSIYKDLLLLTTEKAGPGYAANFDIGIQKT